MKKLGLDLGSSSIGWALREEENINLKGVVTFKAGMSKGTGGYTSPTTDRREARAKRNLISSRKQRKWVLLKILLGRFVPLDDKELAIWSRYKKGQTRKFPENDNFLKWLACDFSYQGGDNYTNPYELRIKALDSKVSDHEFGRALYHLIQRRGYKNIGEPFDADFNQEIEAEDPETKTQLERREEKGFKKALDSHGAISKALKHEFLDKGLRARNQYPLRREYQDELEKIFKAQGYDISRNEKSYKDEFIQSVWQAIIWQQPLKTQKGNIGKCTLEPSKLRCPTSHPAFEVFRAWSFINTIKYHVSESEKKPLPQDYKQSLFEEVFMKKSENFKFEVIRKFLDRKFKDEKRYNYPINRDGKYDTSVSGMPISKGLIDIFGSELKDPLDQIENFQIGNAPKVVNGKYSIYDLWHILFDFDEPYLKKYAVEKLKVDNLTNKKGKEYNPFVKLQKYVQSSYADLSLKAINKIIPFLKAGHLYNEAVLLAKVPEALGETWHHQKEAIIEAVDSAQRAYSFQKDVISITNNLIDKWKADVEAHRTNGSDIHAWNDFSYQLTEYDHQDILEASINFYGDKSWDKSEHKTDILKAVSSAYQEFFTDRKRGYKKLSNFSDLFNSELKVNGIGIIGDLYHHSVRENRYLKKYVDTKTGEIALPTDKATGLSLLPNATIEGIKNPMFNKAMSLLRKVVNELIVSGEIDEETEIIVEVARELNDNNKRAAIERYQREREQKREKYRIFLAEFKEETGSDLNVEDNLSTFESWNEQTFENTVDHEGHKQSNKDQLEILREKSAVKRYQLWKEQKGQCMYTGKMISLSKLFSKEIDIEHTIPRSLLPDNTLANMTVAYAHYNRDEKGSELPYFLPNFSRDVPAKGTAINSRLAIWEKEREKWRSLYESRKRPNSGEDKAAKDKRIQDKHYFRMHLDYWSDKVARFRADEIKDSWARRQLVDTQMISKYAREFLKSYFKKVSVQKGQITAEFRKMYGFQEEDEIKSRNRHTHHAIDAAVLTLIPVNSSFRERMLKEYYADKEKSKHAKQRKPYASFNPQELIRDVETNTLIVNYTKDNLLKKTAKHIRNRGVLQYLLKEEKKIPLIAQGDTVRSDLFKQTYLGKIRNVKRDKNDQPIRDKDGNWEYESGENEFSFTKRIPVSDAKTDLNNGKKPLGYIVDPAIRKIVKSARKNKIDSILDPQGKPIRHVRTISKKGRIVKERINYKSKHTHKNSFYSEAAAIPYAILVENGTTRQMIPLASFEIANMVRQEGKINIQKHLQEHHPTLASYPSKRLLKVGQKVLVLNSDKEYNRRYNADFQVNRLYLITQFSDGNIWLRHHLEAQSKEDIKKEIGQLKDQMLRNYEIPLGITEVVVNENILDTKEKMADYDIRRFRLDNISSSPRLQILAEKVGIEKAKEIKKNLDRVKAISGTIEIEGKTPLLKMSANNWNFLYEGEDFEMSLLGSISLIEEK